MKGRGKQILLVGTGAVVLLGASCCIFAGIMGTPTAEERAAQAQAREDARERAEERAVADSPADTTTERDSGSDDPAPPSAHLASEVPELESELNAIARYGTIWNSDRGEDLRVLLTGVSQLLAMGGFPRSVGTALEDRGLREAARTLFMIQARIGRYPEDFSSRLDQHLRATHDQPHLGIWSPVTRGAPRHDYAALAAWSRREDPGYLREHIGARSESGWGWTNYAASRGMGTPWIDWLSLPGAAYARLAATTRLTDPEWRNWCEGIGQEKVETIDPDTGNAGQACGCPDGRAVTWEEYRERWPLTVPGGCLHCETRQAGRIRLDLVTFHRAGRRYSVNGAAASDPRNAPIDPIWADDPEDPELKISIGALIGPGLLLCQ